MDTKNMINKMLGKEEQKENDDKVKKILGTDAVGKVSAENVINKITGKSYNYEEKEEEEKKDEN